MRKKAKRVRRKKATSYLYRGKTGLFLREGILWFLATGLRPIGLKLHEGRVVPVEPWESDSWR